ncbi:hypothetical protein D9613_005809 [Agrocybe pediades]|uniref:Cytochrome P450 n=1 Tax=Agrocybe pediades TaxID=84607 RepID=A0A8H4QU94_9AGAR|nr:hypothetical protein D9613_005809 [Agrocybe pediades]KAF9561805.1 cytochrome P450 [Agrocybe pediades]
MVLSDLTKSILIAALPVCFTLYSLYSSYLRWLESPTRGLPYPPGPPSVTPLNASSVLPRSQPWLTYTKWAKKYGDILHLKIYGQHTIILSNYEDVVELFEQRSRQYSDRVRSTYINLMGWDFHVGLMPYGDKWRSHRKMFQQCFRPKASLAYRPIQTQKIRDLLNDLLTQPEDFFSHCRKTSTAIIFSTLYGPDLTAENIASFVQIADKAVSALNKSLIPGATVAHHIPFLQHLPSWFPGANYKRQASEVKELTEQMQDMPLSFLGKGIIGGTSSQSLISDLLENCYTQKEYDIIKHVAATSYAAGADTTASSMITFFLAMTLYPEAQRRAQQEIDELLGKGPRARLPTFEDRPHLPFVEAVYREVMRWRPVSPINDAHVTTAIDVYKGFYIPKGASVIVNNWALTRNPDKYPDPESFKPEHFMDENGNLNDDDAVLSFGYGRRNCPGRHMASATIWLTIVSVLAAFDIKKKKDETGSEMTVSPAYTDGLISHPLPFSCTITPRNESIKQLIQQPATS